MQVRSICVILIGAILTGGSSLALSAQDTTMTDGTACTVLLSYASGGFKQKHPPYLIDDRKYRGDINALEPTPTGIHLLAKKGEATLEYREVSTLDVYPKTDPRKIVFRNLSGHFMLEMFFPSGVDGRLLEALNRFVSDAHVGHLYSCRPPLTPAEAAKELADFQGKAAAWRAMNPKPPLSDEVTKKRLLAEDAVQQKDLAGAGDYYSAGTTIDPTWAAGWYNAALINAELKDYSAAALDMKHYLILLPDAPDAAAAKDKLLLWEAKSEEAGKN